MMRAGELAEMLMVKPDAVVKIDVGANIAEEMDMSIDPNTGRYATGAFGVDNENFLDRNIILLEL